MATDLGFGEVSPDAAGPLARYAGRLVIPSFSARGTITHATFRCMEPHDCEGHGKYLHWQGVDSRLYNVVAVQTPEPVIHICEGQLDAATLVACGLPAVGVPGAQAWKPHHHRLFQGFDRVLFWADQDDKGASLLLFEAVRKRLRSAELVVLPQGTDVNGFYVQQGADAVRALAADPVQDESHTGSNEQPEDEHERVHYDDDGVVIPF